MIHVGVVDDDALVRRVLTTLLNTQDDISVTWAATDGDEALNHLNSSNQPDVEAVLLDIQMPHIDGITFSNHHQHRISTDSNADINNIYRQTISQQSPRRRSKWFHSKRGFY